MRTTRLARPIRNRAAEALVAVHLAVQIASAGCTGGGPSTTSPAPPSTATPTAPSPASTTPAAATPRYLSPSRPGRPKTSLPPLDPVVLDELRALAASSHTPALLLARGDDVVIDLCPGGRGPFSVASISKGITALAVARLVDEGRLDFDEPLANIHPTWRDDERRAIRVRDVLSHTSGLSGTPADGVGHVDRAWSLPLVSAPAGEAHYNLVAYDLMPEVIESRSGLPFDRFINERLMEPSGAAPITWARDEQGDVIASAGARVTVDDLLALGRMVLQGGMVADGEVLRTRTLDVLTTPHGTQYWRGQGLGWFMQYEHETDLQWDLVEARGATGHMLTVMPGKNLVLVRIQSPDGNHGVPEAFHALLRRL